MSHLNRLSIKRYHLNSIQNNIFNAKQIASLDNISGYIFEFRLYITSKHFSKFRLCLTFSFRYYKKLMFSDLKSIKMFKLLHKSKSTFLFFCFSSSRKRRPSYSQDGEMFLGRNGDDQMNECSAALVLMSLSCSPHSPHQWAATATISTNGLGTSPGGSSTSSWSSSESSSLSDECATSTSSSSRIRTTSLSMSDEGIVMDYSDEMPRKRRVSQRKTIQIS